MAERTADVETELSVLLVEDNPGDRDLIKTYLRRIDTALLPADITLHDSESLTGALSTVEERPVDLVLLDLGLPEYTGIETLHALVAETEDLPIVVLTGLDDDETAIEAIQSGAQDYLNKGDLDEGTLARTIRYAIERKKRERVLREHKRQLEVLTRLVRHDIKNDLTLIQGPLKLLRDDEDISEDGRSHLENALNASRHVTDLIETAGNFVEEIARDEETSLEVVDATDVLVEEVEKARETYPHAEFNLSEELPRCRCRADGMVSSVFRNLINNAVQHHEGAEPVLDIDLESAGESVAVRVADDGPGFPSAVKDRLDGDVDDSIEHGNGVGLQLVSTLVDRYEGDLRVEDRQPEGTVVTVELPAVREEPG